MWMMGYNEGGGHGHELNNINTAAAADSFNAGRRFRPLIPRPFACSAAAAGDTTAPNDHLPKPTDVFFLNNHQLGGTMGEQNKRDQVMMMNTSTQPVVVSSRWNPTPEQLRVLEDLYQRGTRTPSADQIQHITAQLRRFGKIEGKNVFYWFQNHKARERQKRRRHLESFHDSSFDRKDPGSSRTDFEVEQTNKNWISSPCNTAQTEESVGRGRATKAVMGAENRWVQLNGEDIWLQERRNLMGRNATWHQMMQLPHHHHLILNSTSVASIATNTINNVATAPSATAMVTIPALSSASQARMFGSKRGMDAKKHQDCTVFNGESDHQTLQLFPLSREEDGDSGEIINEKETDHEKLSDQDEAMNGSNCFTHSHHFYEFLPLKN